SRQHDARAGKPAWPGRGRRRRNNLVAVRRRERGPTMPPSRRQVLGHAGAAAATALLGRRLRAAPEARVEAAGVISRQPTRYHGWPTLARRRDGQLVLVYSGGREAHVCPFGRVELMRSRDGGATWSWPQVLLDSPIDDRDAGVVETADGALLVTT